MRHPTVPSTCLLLLASLVVASAALATVEVTLAPLQGGDDEREDGVGTCLNETTFYAGTVATAANLKIGGEAAGCDSEWGSSLEFDLSDIPPHQPVLSATLIVRKTGYSDDSQGFAYLGAYAYAATGGVVSLDRAALTPETALDVLYPSAANVDLSFDVTAGVLDLVNDGMTRLGVFLAGVYSEVGYEDWISIGGTTSYAPPRLVVVSEGTIPAETGTWSAMKACYR